MSHLGSDNSNNSHTNNTDDKDVHIAWTIPGMTSSTTTPTTDNSSAAIEAINLRNTKQQQQRMQRCIDLAISCATDFNANFQIYHAERERAIPQFHPDEIRLVVPPPEVYNDSNTNDQKQEPLRPIRVAGFYKEYVLRDIQLLPEQNDGINDPTLPYYKAKQHFSTAKPSSSSSSQQQQPTCNTTTKDQQQHQNHYYYSVKFLQDGIMATDHGPHATTEMIVESKLLMNLSLPSQRHPHIMKLYGITSSSIASSLSSPCSSSITGGTDSYFYITDRISETLSERIDQWRRWNDNCFTISESAISYSHTTAIAADNNAEETTHVVPHVTKRLEIALDVASALIYLHDRNIVYYVRPDKIGFDVRFGVVKLCFFGQCRQHNMESNPRSVTQSDNMNVLAYTAPEVFCMAPAQTVADVYGFGILLWEIMCLQRPYDGYDRCQHFEQVVRNHVRPQCTNGNETTDWDTDLAKLIQRCLRPYQRPTMKEVHTTIETKLLYYEPPSNDIVDTAQCIQRRRSATLLEQLKMSNTVVFQNDPITTATTTITSPSKTTKTVMVPKQQTRQLSQNSSKDKRDSSDSNKSIQVRSSTNDHDRGDNSSCEALNASGNSIMSGASLDELLQEVSDQLTGDDGGVGGGDKSNDVATTRRSSKELNTEDCRLSVSPRSRNRVPSRCSSRSHNKITTRRSRGRSGSAKPRRTADEADVPSELNNRLQKVRTDSSDDYQEKGDFGDDEDLIASIMSQSDATSLSVISPEQGPTKTHPFRVTAVRKSLLGTKSPIRLRQRSRSRSKSLSQNLREIPNLLPDDESIAESAAVSTTSSKLKLKLSPAQAAAQNAARTPRYGSTPRSSREKPPPRTLSRSDSDSTLGIRRKRRASVAEVKQKFDFVPDSPKKRVSQKNLSGLQKAVERASPIRSSSSQRLRKEKSPLSPTINIVQAGKNILNGVFRRSSGKGVEEIAPRAAETTAVRRQMRRGSASLVQDIVQQQSSSRLIDRKSSSWRENNFHS